MKKLMILLLIGIILLISGCTTTVETKNVDKTEPSDCDPNFFLGSNGPIIDEDMGDASKIEQDFLVECKETCYNYYKSTGDATAYYVTKSEDGWLSCICDLNNCDISPCEGWDLYKDWSCSKKNVING